MKAWMRVIALVLVAVWPSACGFIPAYTRANERSAGTACPETRARQDAIEEDVFVGIALSGGGSRAANFSAAVLFELQHLGLLRTASAISSVSGSSLTAAYYGLFASTPRWDRARVAEALLTDFQTHWIFRWFAPHNATRYWLTDFDRSDIMKGVFDDFLFEKKTFEALGKDGPRILINATSRTRADSFVFTDRAFKELGSCLADYPLAPAVMASGAFPAAFDDVTLEKYGPVEGQRRFEHLYDGGATDNLGLDTLWYTVVEQLRASGGTRPKKCFFFVVDAFTTPERPDLEEKRDTRTALDHIVNTNAIAAFDALLVNRRLDTMWYFGFQEEEVGKKAFKEVSLDFGDEHGGQWKIPCAVWHLTFERLKKLIGDASLPQSVVDEMRSTWEVVNRIPTRYHLTHPDTRYTAEGLQAALFRAARLLVREDVESLRAACHWFRASGFRDACPGLDR